MIKVIATGVAEASAKLKKIESQIPFATAVALTRTAQTVKKEIEGEMKSVFDRPTRWTLNSLRLVPAKKDKLEARVVMKDAADKSVPATRWLNPEIEGGPRRDKASERQMRMQGVLPSGKYIAPGKGAKLDRFGNMTKGQITKIMSGVGGFNEAGFDANATDSKRSRRKGNAKRYFVLRRGSMPLGIAERFGRGKDSIRMVLAFVRKPNYKRRLDFYGLGQRVIDRELPKELKASFARALATAR